MKRIAILMITNGEEWAEDRTDRMVNAYEDWDEVDALSKELNRTLREVRTEKDVLEWNEKYGSISGHTTYNNYDNHEFYVTSLPLIEKKQD